VKLHKQQQRWPAFFSIIDQQLSDMSRKQHCPCDSDQYYQPCAPLHVGYPAEKKAPLIRDRYRADVLYLEDYRLNTWHPSPRSLALGLSEQMNTKCLGLSILHTAQALLAITRRHHPINPFFLCQSCCS
jgi:hypothetical protein